MITVVGLGIGDGVLELLDRIQPSIVAVRNRAAAAEILGDLWSIDRDYGQLFHDGDPLSVASEVAEDLTAISEHQQVIYLVPWSAQIGDRTVEVLTEHPDLALIPGTLPPHRPYANLQVIDALQLAEDERRQPFGPVTPLDPATSVLVLNLHDPVIGEIAIERLTRAYGEIECDATSGYCFISGKSHLDASRSFTHLENIVGHLRSPIGCPWDREQTPETLVPQLIEEVDEFREAVESGDLAAQVDELGDVLLHVLMQAQIRREAGEFDIEHVIQGLAAKLIRRHPHVFGDVEVSSMDEIYEIWDQVKQQERKDAEESENH